MLYFNRILLIFFINLFISCNENIQLSVEDVKKYDYLNPFITNDILKFQGIHNIDSGFFEFSYEVNHLKDFLCKIEEEAKKESWNKEYLNNNTYLYSKKIEIYKSETNLVIVKVKFFDDSNRIHFKVE